MNKRESEREKDSDTYPVVLFAYNRVVQRDGQPMALLLLLLLMKGLLLGPHGPQLGLQLAPLTLQCGAQLLLPLARLLDQLLECLDVLALQLGQLTLVLLPLLGQDGAQLLDLRLQADDLAVLRILHGGPAKGLGIEQR